MRKSGRQQFEEKRILNSLKKCDFKQASLQYQRLHGILHGQEKRALDVWFQRAKNTSKKVCANKEADRRLRAIIVRQRLRERGW